MRTHRNAGNGGAGTPRGDTVMADIVYLGITVGFFALTWALIRLCERL